MGLGIFVASYSYKLGLGKISSPGPGLFPFLLGALFALLSFFKLLAAFLKRDKVEEGLQEEGGPVNYTKLCLVGASLFAYGIFLEPLGYIIITFLVMAILFRATGYKIWPKALGYSAIVVVITYFLFTNLGTRFPSGLLTYFGIY